MNIEETLRYLISQGHLTQEQFDKRVEAIKQENSDNPNSLTNANKNIVLLKEESLILMDVSASLYEENLALKDENAQLQQDNLATMETLAEVYELML